MAILATRRRWLVTSLWAAARSPCSRQRLASIYSSCGSSMGNRWISARYRVRLESPTANDQAATCETKGVLSSSRFGPVLLSLDANELAGHGPHFGGLSLRIG